MYQAQHRKILATGDHGLQCSAGRERRSGRLENERSDSGSSLICAAERPVEQKFGVTRGYGAAESLQQMHNQAIDARTS